MYFFRYDEKLHHKSCDRKLLNQKLLTNEVYDTCLVHDTTEATGHD